MSNTENHLNRNYIPPPFQLSAGADGRGGARERTPSWQKPEDLAVALWRESQVVDGLSREYQQATRDIANYDREKGLRIQELTVQQEKLKALSALRAFLEFGVNINDPTLRERLAGIYRFENEDNSTSAPRFSPTPGALLDMVDDMEPQRTPADKLLQGGRSLDERDILETAITYNQFKPPVVAAELLKLLGQGSISEGTRIGQALQAISELEVKVAALLDRNDGEKKQSDLPQTLSLILDALLENLGKGGSDIVRRLEEIVVTFSQLGRTGLSADFREVLYDPAKVVDYSRDLTILYVIQWLLARANIEFSRDDKGDSKPAVIIQNQALKVEEQAAVRKMAVQLAILRQQKQALKEVVAGLKAHPAADPSHKARIDQELDDTKNESLSTALWLGNFRARGPNYEDIFRRAVLCQLSASEDRQLAPVVLGRARSALTTTESHLNQGAYCELPEMEYLKLLFGENLRVRDGKIVSLPLCGWYSEGFNPELPVAQFISGIVGDPILHFDWVKFKTSKRPERSKDIPQYYSFMQELQEALSRYFDWTYHLSWGEGGWVEGFAKGNQMRFYQPPGFHSIYDLPKRAWQALDELVDLEKGNPDYTAQLYQWIESVQQFPGSSIFPVTSLPIGTVKQMLLLKNRDLLDYHYAPKYSELALVQDGWLVFVSRHQSWTYPIHRRRLNRWITSTSTSSGYRTRDLVFLEPELFQALPESFTSLDWTPNTKALHLDIAILPFTDETKRMAASRADAKFYIDILEKLYLRATTEPPPNKRSGVVLLPPASKAF